MSLDPFFCSALSRGHGEPLYGTASHFRQLFLLEYCDSWGAKAFGDSRIADDIKQALKDKLNLFAQSRLLFIKQTEKARDRINFFAVHVDPVAPYYNHLVLNDYTDLIDLDFTAALQRRETSSDEPLYLVCTNGNKDKCCAKFGMACYKSLLRHVAAQRVWQCAHVGGDRFAPNIVTAPTGAFFGRVPDDTAVKQLVAQVEQKQLGLDYYRGCAAYTRSVQCADYFLRAHLNNTAMHDLHYIATHDADGYQQVRFRIVSSGQDMLVTVQAVQSDYESYLSCQATEPSRVESFELVDIQPVT